MPGPYMIPPTDAEERDPLGPWRRVPLDHLALAAIFTRVILPGPTVIGGDDLMRWGGVFSFWRF